MTTTTTGDDGHTDGYLGEDGKLMLMIMIMLRIRIIMRIRMRAMKVVMT